MSQYVVVWEFIVKTDKMPLFETIYGSEGLWAQLFQKGEGFIRSELIQDIETPNRYLVRDYWQSREQYLLFREMFNQEYEELNAETTALKQSETCLGAFQRISNNLPCTVPQ